MARYLADPLSSSGHFKKAVKDDDAPLEGTTIALLVGVGGTANLMDESGEIKTDVPLQQGYNPLRVKQVRLGGTADDIWELY